MATTNPLYRIAIGQHMIKNEKKYQRCTFKYTYAKMLEAIDSFGESGACWDDVFKTIYPGCTKYKNFDTFRSLTYLLDLANGERKCSHSAWHWYNDSKIELDAISLAKTKKYVLNECGKTVLQYAKHNKPVSDVIDFFNLFIDSKLSPYEVVINENIKLNMITIDDIKTKYNELNDLINDPDYGVTFRNVLNITLKNVKISLKTSFKTSLNKT